MPGLPNCFVNNAELHKYTNFSVNGNEVAFGTIGDASTSEGPFWETINAAGVLQVPMAISVWDDGFGISVPAKYQTTKQNISEILSGFAENEKGAGYQIYVVNGWDYPSLCQAYQEGIAYCRQNHVPILFHIREITQPQGHSTSGSHERYKTKERLEWEAEYDCIKKMREWMLESAIASAEDLDAIENEAKKTVKDAQKRAWDNFKNPIKEELKQASELLSALAASNPHAEKAVSELLQEVDPIRKDVAVAVRKALLATRGEENEARTALSAWYSDFKNKNHDRYNAHLYAETENSALKVAPIAIQYADDAPMVDGRELLQANFDYLFANNDKLVAFGEDVGKIGDVNQGFAGLQEKYGEIRISDTGIRESTIIGQGIGIAMRGLRPIAEIQYLDYLLFGISSLSDDLATVAYRTKGGQKAPVIVRTRGHRLEGVWHSGSPMGMILGSLRGMYVLVPRNMTQAAGFYNTMLQSDDPALIIEPLNGYRIKEKMPANIGEYRIALGMPEVLQSGNDITLVTYGSCIKIAQDAIKQLENLNISVELIDVQSLLPFDIEHSIVASLKKTNKVLFLDEDVPGGGSAYMMQKVLVEQEGFQYLDAAPQTLAAKEHRPPYGSDGDYFSKPSAEDIVEKIYTMMAEYAPDKFLSF